MLASSVCWWLLGLGCMSCNTSWAAGSIKPCGRLSTPTAFVGCLLGARHWPALSAHSRDCHQVNGTQTREQGRRREVLGAVGQADQCADTRQRAPLCQGGWESRGGG